MTDAPRVRRGEPLLVLGALLIGWFGLRAATWEGISLPRPAALARSHVLGPEPAARTAAPVSGAVWRGPARSGLPAAPFVALPPPQSPGAVSAPPVMSDRPAPQPTFLPPVRSQDRMGLAMGHQIGWMAGVAQLPLPGFVLGRPNRAPLAAPTRPLPTGRWTFDGWLLLRGGGSPPVLRGIPGPTYGDSQAGAVLRYRLAPSSAHRPALFVRAASALHQPRGEEVALGLSVRPFAKVPVALHAEARLTAQPAGAITRPAVYAVTELPRLDLPLGLSGESYLQAGLVGGLGGTAFADGLVRLDRPVARLGGGELRAGLGAWGGAQRGASRLDLGPSATLDFAIGSGQGRISADWRLRAAGNAAPVSGPAITLSAGF